MEVIRINATEDTPNVILDHVNKVFEISGRSLPEDVVVFYEPVMQWLRELENAPVMNLEFGIKLEYFNTASSKLLLDILLKLEAIYQNGIPMKVKWYFVPADCDMREAGEEYAEIVGIPFEFVEY